MLSDAGQKAVRARRASGRSIDEHQASRCEGANDPANPFPTPAKLLTIDEDFGGWSAASKKFFDPRQRHRHQDPAGDRQVVTTVHHRRSPAEPARRRRPAAGRGRLTLPLARSASGSALIWFSLLVLIPLIAVLVETAEGGWAGFWDTITNPQTAAAIRLTVDPGARSSRSSTS